MPEHGLPDDHRDWPHDPFELLGVPPDVDGRELRRAYNRLIRIYRPEDRPEEFQKIRAAYELLQSFVEHQQSEDLGGLVFGRGDLESNPDEPPRWSRRPGSSSSKPPEDAPAPQSRQPEPGQPEPDEHPVPSQPFRPDGRPSVEQRMESAWKTARAGEVARAWSELLQIRNERPSDPQPVLRLYWLLVIAPEADSQRLPVDLVCQALETCGFEPALLTLYERELIREPALVARPSGRDILRVAPRRNLEGLTDARWRAASRVEAWEVIRLDLEQLRERLSLDAPLDWARMVFDAVDHLAWSQAETARTVLRSCLTELETFHQHELELADEIEQLHRLKEFTSATPNLGGLPGAEDLLALIRESWQRMAYEVRGLVLSVLETWVNNPSLGLELLDRLGHASPAGLEQVWRIVQQMPVPWSVLRGDRRSDEVSELIHDFLRRELPGAYRGWRTALAEFCIEEAITLDEVIRHLCEHSAFDHGDDAARDISTDLALRCVHHGCLAFLGAMSPAGE